VREAITETFTTVGMNWGNAAAVAAYITQVALNCARHRLHSVIIPLLNYAAEMLDQHMLHFIRATGGWAAFTVAFRPERTVSWGNILMNFVAGAIVVSLASVIFSLYMR
jgi:hypothetical protein